MKGIILAGGTGSRLYPLTKSINKHLFPLFNKPLIYYSISVLFFCKIKDILIIINEKDYNSFYNLLGDGSKFGVKFTYKFQKKPIGIVDAFLIGESFIKKDKVCLVLGDNIFYGQGFLSKLNRAKNRSKGATIFAYPVNNPENFGVIEFNKKNKALKIEEKPKKPKSNFAIPGLYFYDNSVVNYSKKIKLSKRNELEISDLNNIYLNKNSLFVEEYGRGFAWFDSGTYEGMHNAGSFIQMVEKRQNLQIGCLEEIACRNNWISPNTLINMGRNSKKSSYGDYLIKIGRELKK